MLHNLRDTLIKIVKSRFFTLIMVFIVLFSVTIGRVFYLQIVNGKNYLTGFKLQIQKTQEIKSTRGNIYDRNGNLLAYNELAYSVTIEDTGAFDNLDNNGKNDALNNTILDVLGILDKNGDKAASYFDIYLDESGNFAFTDDEGSARNRFIADVYGKKSFKDLSDAQKQSTPDKIMSYLCSDDRYHIDIDKVGKADALRIVNVRYAMTAINYTKYLVTTVAQDVSDQTVAAIKENQDELEGISVTEEALRHYNDAEYFSSIIGYTGVISTDEYEELSKDNTNYSLNDVVGKAGIEQEMDPLLQGTKGKQTFYVDSMGSVLETGSVTDPIAGNDLYLTIDKDLQIAVYQILEQKLAGIIYEKLVPSMTYDPHGVAKTTDIAIPIGDVYTSFFENMVLDITAFPKAAAGTVQAGVYGLFQTRQAEVLSYVQNELTNPSGSVSEAGDAGEAYQRYIVDQILTARGILNADRIDKEDATYQAWQDGSISLLDYLNYAISQDWIDSSGLRDLTDSSEKYSDSSEIISAISTYLDNTLKDDVTFSRLIYKYMVLDGTIPGSDVCLLLYEQGILEKDDAAYAALSSGAMAPYDFLREKIKALQIKPAQLAVEPNSASCVVTDPNSGEVLACVSYPGYDNNRLSNTMDSAYYNRLLKDASKPLYNHATQEKTAPGSTYKMVSTMAGLESGTITPDTGICCTGEFTRITPSPKCWIYPGAHGTLGIVSAIANSCNNFFFEVGYELGQDSDGNYSSDRGVETLAEYAAQFGLGEKSGIELPEAEPQISDTDSVRSAIGQGTNNYTTVQLARYVTACANRGTVYNLTLLGKSTDSSGLLIEDFHADVRNRIEADESTWDLIQGGMRGMVEISTQFSDLNAEGLDVSGKTGTAQQSDIHPDHCLFVGYAPSDNPEIAFAVRIANGYTSAYTAQIGKELCRYYFHVGDESVLNGQASDIGPSSAITGD